MATSQAALLIGKIAHARREWEALSATLALKEYGTSSRQEFMRNCREGMYDDVVAVYRSNASTSVSEGSFRVDRGFGMGWEGREGRADICGG
jgi:glyoxylate reductase